ncbi:hypothetical protein ABZW11_11710 [Nonomuraea sp. NPDC004580]|uniref:hypothetical protein n=1 Tax=Nonomuraea sp. NPDC004580 TaxID=3154552 RepID=UPI0033A683A7
MINEYLPDDNDGRFPEDTLVLVRYPLREDRNDARDSWPWLPGTVLAQCGRDERRVVVEVPALAIPHPNVPNGDAPENLLYPACFRDATEIRAVSMHVWQRVRNEAVHG